MQSSRCSLSKKEVNDVEISILNAIQHMRTPILDTIMCVITKLGNAGMIWILLTVILLIIPKTRRTGVILMLALCVDVVLCNGILKNLVGRIRPFDVNTSIQLLVARPHDYSFPSGHTAASFTAAMAPCRREQDVETGTGTCRADRIFQIIPVRTLSDRHFGRNYNWMHCGLYRISIGRRHASTFEMETVKI